MINVVYLILVFTGGSGQMTSQAIPQANMQQCLVNAKHQLKNDNLGRYKTSRAFCIVGVK